jgi:branched-chain amino acid transport system permease protein
MFATVALNGLTVSALYFIVAIGFSLIFGFMRSVNMAHGTLFLVGAYAGVAVFYPLYDAGNPYAWIAALLAGIAASAVLGVILQVVFLGWMQGQELRQTLATIGISIIVADQLLAIFGGLSQQFYAPDILFGSVSVPFVQGGQYSTFRLFQIAVALAVGLGLWLILQHTKLGSILRAGVDDRAMLSALGVNVALVSVFVFAIGGGLAGLAGVVGGTAQPFGQEKDVEFLLTSLVVVIVGGMGSLPGTALGALLVGMAEQFGQSLFPAYSVMITLLIMVGVLAIRPQGLLGRTSS